MSESKQTHESNRYARLGASSSKEGVHRAVGDLSSHDFFASVIDDVTGDPEYYSLLHADGAGTKSIVAYLAFRETGSTDWFESVAQDSLVMNLDDVACVNALESLALSNTIGRNKNCIPDEAIAAVINGYRNTARSLQEVDIEIALAGGETADMGDLIRTLVLDSTLYARVKRSEAISTNAITPGDAIIGFCGTGKARYEQKENSGLGSNGYTLARHALLKHSYCQKYPEILDPMVDKSIAYQGPYALQDTPDGLGMSVAEALLSPTRTYAPIIKKIAAALKKDAHGFIHCSGGGQAKAIRFGKGVRYIKDNLFPCPPVFELIQQSASVPWQEMYTVFNMGHRMELMCPPERVDEAIAISAEFSVEAQQIGYVEKAPDGANSVVVRSDKGEFTYST